MSRVTLLLLTSDNSTTINTTLILSFFLFVFIFIGVYFIDKKINHIVASLKYKRELIFSLGANIDNVIIIFDLNNLKYDYISHNIEKALEINERVLRKDGKKLLYWLPEDKRQKIFDFFTPSGNYDWIEDDFEYIKPISKKKCWLLLRIYRVSINKKEIRYIINTVDITREKKTQMELEEALMKLQKANEAKKIFLSHISHELKTPINGIIGMSQIALNSLKNKDKTVYCLNKINYSSRKLLTLINNILDISKMDRHKLVLSRQPFQLSEVLTSFSSFIHSQAEMKGQKYSFILKNIKNDYLLGDSLRLIQILENCISNSLKFTPEGGKIKLEVTEGKRYADKVLFQFEISDTGKGMEEDYINRLYEPFVQEDESIAQLYGGTGIGMAIVKELIDLMGGSIQVKTKLNEGTHITIQIVFRINTSPIKFNGPMEDRDILHFQGKRILLVEDNEINMEITYETLKNIHCEVTKARNGYEALELFKASPKGYYHVILMDIQMPKMDGYETARAIRECNHPDAKTIIIIAQTADDFTEKEKSYDSGMNYHMTKSIEADYIYDILNQIFKKET